jgi:hypothetical protein
MKTLIALALVLCAAPAYAMSVQDTRERLDPFSPSGIDGRAGVCRERSGRGDCG